MATVHPSSIEIAGSAWPVFKLEALAAGVTIGLILAVILGSAQIGVLVGAAVAAARWVVGSVAVRRAESVRHRERVLSAH